MILPTAITRAYKRLFPRRILPLEASLPVDLTALSQSMRFSMVPVALLLAFSSLISQAIAQAQLDPIRDAAGAPLESSLHQPLPEQYIWTAPDKPASDADRIAYVFPKVTEKTESHFFRRVFDLQEVPKQATLYVAGPRRAVIYLNGRLVESVESDVTQPLGMHVFAVPVAGFLKTGQNLLAMKVVAAEGSPASPIAPW